MSVVDFSYLEVGDPGVPEDLSPMREVHFNLPRLKEAREVCSTCPVKGKCLESATPSDRFWTVRGGELPKLARTNVKKNNFPSAKTDPYMPDLCQRGHSNWLRRADGTAWYCGDCNNRNKQKGDTEPKGSVHWMDED